MIRGTFAFLFVLSALVSSRGIAEPVNHSPRIEPIQIAFADVVRPRGIKLSDGEDEPEVDAEAEAVERPPTTFKDLIQSDEAVLNDHSLETLVKGSPLFSPIEGLPDAAWKDQACSNCHEWTQERLCTQGEFYVKQGLGAVDRKQHPYGGAFKREVMEWAQRGCE